ncbi:MAG: hypothetical protein NVS3B12_18150 [Acidimicrobiales bacterium]
MASPQDRPDDVASDTAGPIGDAAGLIGDASAPFRDAPGNPLDGAVGLDALAGRLGVVMRSSVDDATGWRWRAAWRGIEIAAWNDMDGVAVVADVGPWDEWVGLRGHRPDPTADEAMQWTIDVLAPWLVEPANAERIAQRTAIRASGGGPSTR